MLTANTRGLQGRVDPGVPHPADEFSAEDGLMTPSLKLRRAAIVKAYAAEINRMYAARPSG